MELCEQELHIHTEGEIVNCHRRHYGKENFWNNGEENASDLHQWVPSTLFGCVCPPSAYEYIP